MIVLAGADLALPDRVLPRGTLVIDADRIVAVEAGRIDPPAGAERVDLSGCIVVPGFVDVHVHGVEGCDVLDGDGALAEVAARLPRYGVTSFCPTSTACDAVTLQRLLIQVAALRAAPPPLAARVLPAHLESNFINPEYKGAQPVRCLRRPPVGPRSTVHGPRSASEPDFSAEDILATIQAARAEVGIITVAPELDGGMDLVRTLVAAGHRLSIGHSGASYEQTLEAIEAGVSHATHLFNRMSPLSHRAPGVPGAVLRSTEVRAELICDGFHVHPALVELAIRTKGSDGIMAITDGTAGSGLAVGARTRLGGQPIVVTARSAELDDGTLAGSVLTMDGAFRMLVQGAGATLVEAARMCATTPAMQMGLTEVGRIAVGMRADLVVLTANLRMASTYLDGRLWGNPLAAPLV